MPRRDTPFGVLLTMTRNDRKMTIAQAAWRARMSAALWRRYENGYVADPRWSQVIRLADALGTTTEELRPDRLR